MAYYNAPFPYQPEYTAIALAYRNRSYIADQVLPRVGVGSREFKWLKYNRDEMFTIPETMVGRNGVPNQVEFGATEESSFVKDYGLDDYVPTDDVNTAPPNYDPLGRAIEGIAELIALDREKRTADLVFNTSTYPAGNVTTLSGSSQWSDTTSDPYSAIMTALDGMIMRPNTWVIGRAAWTKLRVHPKITAALAPSTAGNSATTNANGAPANAQAVADLFELDQIIVGEAWVNTAKKGQTASMSRLWGKHSAFLHINPLASLTNGAGITFGATAEYGTRVGGTEPDSERGLRGSIRCRAGESVRELIVANDVGYYFANCVA